MADAARKFDEHLPAIIKGAQRPPWRIVPLDLVAEIQCRDVNAGGDWRGLVGLVVLLPDRDQLVLRIIPRDRCHVGRHRGAQLQVIGPPVGVDDEVRG